MEEQRAKLFRIGCYVSGAKQSYLIHRIPGEDRNGFKIGQFSISWQKGTGLLHL